MIHSLNANFLQTLNLMQMLFFWFGIFACVLFLAEMILLFFPSSSLSLPKNEVPPVFSEKTVTAFLAAGSWAGFITSFFVENIWLPILIALLFGALSFTGTVFLIRKIVKVQKSNFLNRFAGADAVVSAKIPPERKGYGKIVLLIKDSYEKLDAVTDETDLIPVGSPVKILEYTDDFAVVCRLEKRKIGNKQTKIQREMQAETGAGINTDRFNGKN